MSIHDEQESLSMGRYGAAMVAPSNTGTGNFCAIYFVETGTLSALASEATLSGTWTGVSFSQGSVLLGPFSSFTTDASARVIAYYGNKA